MLRRTIQVANRSLGCRKWTRRVSDSGCPTDADGPSRHALASFGQRSLAEVPGEKFWTDRVQAHQTGQPTPKTCALLGLTWTSPDHENGRGICSSRPST